MKKDALIVAAIMISGAFLGVKIVDRLMPTVDNIGRCNTLNDSVTSLQDSWATLKGIF